MKKDPRVYLAHILECAQKIERYTHGGEKEFQNDTMLQDAVIRNFEIIGEAAKRVPEATRLQPFSTGVFTSLRTVPIGMMVNIAAPPPLLLTWFQETNHFGIQPRYFRSSSIGDASSTETSDSVGMILSVRNPA